MSNFFTESALLAFRTLAKNKLRTILSVLATAIGITSIVVIVSAGGSLKALFDETLTMFGTNFIEVEIKIPNTEQASISNTSGIAQGISITTLSLDDKKDIDALPNVTGSYGAVTGQASVVSPYNEKRYDFYGVSHEFDYIDSGEIAEGRFYTADEEEGLARVVVLGNTVAKEMFPNQSAVGQTIKIQKHRFRVIGVFENRGSVAFFDMDKLMYIPLKTAHKLLLGFDHLIAIFAHIEDVSKDKQTAEEITAIIRENHGITDPKKDDFAVMTQREAAEMVNLILRAITVVLGLIASIALIVSGVGIMNIMYVAVSERIFEIGLRKAVGANTHSIRFQFLIEAIVITFLSGLFGVLFAFLLLVLIFFIASYRGFDWPFVISIPSVIIALTFSSLIGLFFGYFPAKRASELKPVEALYRLSN